MIAWLLLLYLLFAEFCDLASAAILASTDWLGVTILQNFRDLLAFVLFLIGFLRPDMPGRLRWPVSIYLGIITIYILVGLSYEIDTGLLLRSAAKLALPAILLLAGFAGLPDLKAFRRFTWLAVAIAVASVLFGLWEVKHTEFWTDTVEYGEYLSAGKDLVGVFRWDVFLPYNFFGYDSALGTNDARRAAGLLAAPLAQGPYVSLCGLLGFALLRRRRPWLGAALLALSAYGTYASGTRGALLILVIALPVYLLITMTQAKSWSRDATFVLFGVIFSFQTLSTIYDYSVNLEDGSTIGHLDALRDNLANAGRVLIFGDGIGETGTLAASSGRDVGAGGLEGAVFSALYQIGGPGALSFLWLYGTILVALYRRRLSEGDGGALSAAMAAYAIGATSSLISSDSLMTVSGMAIFWIAMGGLLRVVAEPAAQQSQPASRAPRHIGRPA